MAKKKRAYIYWSKEIKQELIDMVFNMRMKNLNEPLITLLKQAQKQLPEEQRRGTLSSGAVLWLEEGVRKKFEEFKGQKKDVHIQTVVKEVEKDIRHYPIEKLFMVFVNRFFGDLREIKEKIGDLETAFNKSGLGIADEEKNKKAEKKTVITIVGLISEQSLWTKNRFNGTLDLRFLSSQSKFEQLPISTEYIIIMTKFIGHNWQTEAFNKVGRDRVYINDGGMSKLYQILDGIIIKTKNQRSLKERSQEA